MMRLFKIEWAKISRYRPFWILTALYLVFSPLMMLNVHHFDVPFFPTSPEDYYGFPMGWNVAAWTAGWFQILLGIMLVIFASNEFNYKTARQHIIDGLTRNEYFLSKLLLVAFIALFATVYMALNAILASSMYAGGLDKIMEGIKFVPIFFFQTVGYLSIALLFVFLLRSSGYAILIFICVIIAEWFGRVILSANGYDQIATFFPIGIVSNMTPIPFLSELLEMGREQGDDVPFVLSLQERVTVGSLYILTYIGIAFTNWKRRVV